jgi:type II secretory pathway component PulF
MPTFAYTVLDRTGTRSSGSLAAESRQAVVEGLLRQGLSPVSVEELRAAQPRPAAPRRRPGRVSQAAVEAFTRELANLLAAGVPLSRALHILARGASQPAARALWASVHDDVVSGMPLADAMAKWPRSFPPVYTAMVRAGETGGFLDVVLEQIADFRAREQDLKGRVKAAFVYPIVLAVLAGSVLVFLMIYFIPRFSAVFAEFGGSLPTLTRAVMAISGLVSRHGLMMALALAVAVIAVRRVLASEPGERAFQRMILRAPGIGNVIARFALVRFCRMLGTLLGAGVPMVAALRVAREAVGNQTLADAVGRATREVQHGLPLAASLAASPEFFPPAVVEMVAVAEQSGRLDKELVRLAGSYESELDRRLRMLVSLAEPVMLFIMAGLIGTVVISMLLPVFTLQDLIH